MTYTKTINGRQVFSDCRTIQMEDGTWISNPSHEQILEAGWVEFIPEPAPEPEIIPSTEPDMYEVMDAVKKMLSSSITELSDEDALAIAALYPTWISKIGSQVNVGERFWYDEKLYKVIQQHTVQEDWTPDVSQSLFTEVSIEEWPDFVQPISAESAYMIGDKVTFEGRHYVSVMDYNIYSPAAYPQGWSEQ